MPANTAAPTSKDGPVSLGSKPVSQPSQKSMTKAERRELQERQRAAKLAQKQQPQGPSNAAASSSKSKQTSTPQKKAADTNKPATSLGKDASIAAKDAALSVAAAADSVEAQKSRGLRIFSHFGAPKPLGAGVKGDIHPAIVRLGLLFSEFKVCGANARCIATLSAFKIVSNLLLYFYFLLTDLQVIQDYTTPPNNTLSRHLMTHLSPQITYLVSARPMSVTMGNAIRQLKLEISGSDIDLPEQDVCAFLCAGNRR